MRNDFKKVIHEDYRLGEESATKGNKPLHKQRLNNKAEKSPDKELYAKRESSARRRRYGWECKRVTDKAGPKRKFLASRVGKAWDEVHSELCKAGVYKDFVYLVEVNYGGNNSDGHPIDTSGRIICDDFYVDGDGLLQKTPRLNRRKKTLSKEINYVWVGKQLYGRRTDGLWYRLYLKPIPEPNYQWVEVPYYGDKTMMVRRNLANVSYDMWLCRTIYRANEALFDGRYCERYEQVNKKELREIKRRLGLS